MADMMLQYPNQRENTKNTDEIGKIGSLACLLSHPSAQGVLRVEQEIEIRPGIVSKDGEGKVTCVPIYSRIKTLFAELNPLQYAVPGGLIGVGTTVSFAASAIHLA